MRQRLAAILFGRSRIWARLVLAPSAHDIPCRKAEARVPHGTGWVQLWGDISPEAEPALVVLRLLGARGRAELATHDPANRLSRVPYGVWALNPPRFGASSGPLTLSNYMSGALAAYDYLAARYPRARLWVYGKSIGATTAIYLAAHRPLSGVIVKNVIDVVALRPTVWAPAARCPALFVISVEDRVARPHSQLRVAGLYGGPSVVLRVQGGHETQTLHAEDEVRYAEAVRALYGQTGA